MNKLKQVTVPVLMLLLCALLLSSVLYSRESLLTCEQLMKTQVGTLAGEGTLKSAVKFTDVCPEARKYASDTNNKWLEILLALMVQFSAEH